MQQNTFIVNYDIVRHMVIVKTNCSAVTIGKACVLFTTYRVSTLTLNKFCGSVDINI